MVEFWIETVEGRNTGDSAAIALTPVITSKANQPISFNSFSTFDCMGIIALNQNRFSANQGQQQGRRIHGAGRSGPSRLAGTARGRPGAVLGTGQISKS